MKERNEKKTAAADLTARELVAEAKAGDQAAFTELYEQTSAELYRSVRAMVRDEDLAWDILQDSYVRAWRGLDKLEANEAFLPWLRRIAVNVTATQMSQKRALTFTDLAADDDDREPDFPDLNIANQPELALDRKETSRLVREILSELPEEQQLIVGMHYYEDMPINEIAKTLNIAVGTVKAQLFRGRKKVEAGVRALEKKGIKLYGLSPLPFLVALLRRLEPAAQAEQKTLAAVLAETSASSAVKTVTAMTAGQAFVKGLGVKLLAGVLTVSLLAVGGKLGYDALKNQLNYGIERPPVREALDPSELSSEAPTTETQPVPESTEPIVTSEAAASPILSMPAPSSQPEIEYAGGCGLALNWSFDPDTGVLNVGGSGAMYDYGSGATGNPDVPWASFRGDITEIRIAKGVSSIGAEAFRGCGAVTAVTIPAGVTAIGDAAFASCQKLAAASLPEGLVTLGAKAFYDCDSLLTVSIPEGVTRISANVFAECDQLISVDLPAGVSEIGDGAFDGCERLSFLKIPESVTAIGSRAFGDCGELSAVVIPEGVVSIGEQAFKRCEALTAAVLLNRYAVIDDNAFDVCKNLTIYGYPYSTASACAAKYQIPFLSLDSLGDEAIPGYREDMSFLGEADSSWKVESIQNELWIARTLNLYQDGSLYYREGELFSRYYPRCLDGVWRTEEDGTLLLTFWQSPYASNNRPADYRVTAADAPADSRTARFFCERRGDELVLVQQYAQGFYDDPAGTRMEFHAPELSLSAISEDALRELVEENSAELERLAQSQLSSELDGYGRMVSVRGVARSGERFAARITCTAALTISEEELAQARQTAKLTLLGRSWQYLATEGDYGTVYPYRQNGSLNWDEGYAVKRAGNRYFFVSGTGGELRRLETDEGSYWLWLEPETPVVVNAVGEELPKTLADCGSVSDRSCCLLWEETTNELYLWIDAN